MTKPQQDDEKRAKREADKLRDEALLRMLKTKPQPRIDKTGKKSRDAKPKT